MFGIKTLVVGGGAAALLWAMHSHASAGDVANGVKNGVRGVQTGVQAVRNGDQNVQDFQNLLGSGGATGTSGTLRLDASPVHSWLCQDLQLPHLPSP